MPFFSVIVPTYNRSSQIKTMLEFFKKQTFNDFELIIIDDGSTDDTKSIIELNKGNLNVIYKYMDNWGGPAKPRNLGIEISKSKWICFLDSDDIWFDNKLEECFNFIQKNTHIDFIYHPFYLLTKSKKPNKKLGTYKYDNKKHKNFKKLLYFGNKIILSSIVISRSAITKVNKFSENKNIIAIEDYDMILKIAALNINFGRINKVLGSYTISNDSISLDQLNQINRERDLLEKFQREYSEIISLKNISAIINYRLAVYYSAFNKTLSRNNLILVLKNTRNINLFIKSFYKLIKLYV